jgi:hypothetical protein
VKITPLAILAVLIPAVLSAQSADSLSQRGRTLVAVGVGLTGNRDASADASKLSARGNGQVASLAVTHFVKSSVAIDISAAVLDENDFVSGTRAHHEEVSPVLFGVNWSPASLAVSSELRPFVSLVAGPYIHQMDDAAVTGARASMQTVLGARLGAGANWYVARHFALQVEGDYHAVPAFDAVDGVRRNVSGFTLSLGLGVAWGGVK